MHQHHGLIYGSLVTNAAAIFSWHLNLSAAAVIVSSAATVASVGLQFYLAFRGRRDKHDDKKTAG